MSTNKVCFVGHRHVSFGPIRQRVMDAVKQEYENGCRFFTMGTHGEFDKLALSVCREFRKEHPDIKIEVVLTSLHQLKRQVYDDEFGHESSYEYDDVDTVLYDIEEEHFKRQITVSNQKMIDTCTVLICYIDETKTQSGAKTALLYAKRHGLNIINVFRPEDDPTFGMTKEKKQEYYRNLKKAFESEWFFL